MKKTERVRQAISGPLGVEDLKRQTEKGWNLVAIEWEREIESAEAEAHESEGAGPQPLWTRCQPMCHSASRSQQRPNVWKRIPRSGKSCSS
jgi:hypothetical protein